MQEVRVKPEDLTMREKDRDHLRKTLESIANRVEHGKLALDSDAWPELGRTVAALGDLVVDLTRDADRAGLDVRKLREAPGCSQGCAVFVGQSGRTCEECDACLCGPCYVAGAGLCLKCSATPKRDDVPPVDDDGAVKSWGPDGHVIVDSDDLAEERRLHRPMLGCLHALARSWLRISPRRMP